MSETLLKQLSDQFIVSYHPDITKLSDSFYDDLRTADGIIGSKLIINKPFIQKALNIKIVSSISAGYDNIDVDYLTSKNIMLTNTPGVLADSVVDTIFALMLAAARRVPELDNFVKEGEWKHQRISSNLYGLDVHHKVLGIVGMGGIGKTLARRAKYGFDMNVIYYNRKQDKDAERKLGVTYMPYNELLSRADYIVVLVPLTNDTYKMIGEEAFFYMKSSAIFINCSRGDVVDEEELIKALTSRKIFAAGLDVYSKEPLPSDSRLLKLSNVITLPHVGSSTQETKDKMIGLAIENLIDGLNGKLPKNLINAEVVDRKL
ncbi:D-glycerate dehydrogenase [Sporosarcina sp. P33]|nr:D-glycerate dehydrogenase [Sporosarcina sp. P33]